MDQNGNCILLTRGQTAQKQQLLWIFSNSLIVHKQTDQKGITHLVYKSTALLGVHLAVVLWRHPCEILITVSSHSKIKMSQQKTLKSNGFVGQLMNSFFYLSHQNHTT